MIILLLTLIGTYAITSLIDAFDTPNYETTTRSIVTPNKIQINGTTVQTISKALPHRQN